MNGLSAKETEFLDNVAKWLFTTRGASAVSALTTADGLDSAMKEYTKSFADFRTKLLTSDKAVEAMTIQVYYDVRTEEAEKRNTELKRDAMHRLFV